MPIKKYYRAKDVEISDWNKAVKQAPGRLLRSNAKMARSNFVQWSIPSFRVDMPSGPDSIKQVTTCPTAGSCKNFCYAQQGGYAYKNTLISHARNLNMYFTNPDKLRELLVAEIEKLVAPKLGEPIRAVRVHDSGDFLSRDYMLFWMCLARSLPDVQFYAYTKRVRLSKKLAELGEVPPNFELIFSYGGTEDDLIDPEKDRHSKVFETHEDLLKSGYHDASIFDTAAADSNVRRIGFFYHGNKGFKGTATGPAGEHTDRNA